MKHSTGKIITFPNIRTNNENDIFVLNNTATQFKEEFESLITTSSILIISNVILYLSYFWSYIFGFFNKFYHILSPNRKYSSTGTIEKSGSGNSWIWTITDFDVNELRENPIKNSPPFYTSDCKRKTGYKIRITMKIEYIKDKEYLSLFFQFLRSNKMHKVSWPMTNLIKLEILHPNDSILPHGKIHGYNICNEKYLEVFKKPLGVNNSFGTKKFIGIEYLNKYIVKNKIMIQFTIYELD